MNCATKSAASCVTPAPIEKRVGAHAKCRMNAGSGGKARSLAFFAICFPHRTPSQNLAEWPFGLQSPHLRRNCCVFALLGWHPVDAGLANLAAVACAKTDLTWCDSSFGSGSGSIITILRAGASAVIEDDSAARQDKPRKHRRPAAFFALSVVLRALERIHGTCGGSVLWRPDQRADRHSNAG